MANDKDKIGKASPRTDKTSTRTVNDILDDLRSGKIDWGEAAEEINKSPRQSQTFRALMQQRDPVIMDIQQKLGSGFRSLIGAIGAGVGASQVKAGREGLEGLEPPSAPKQLGLSPELSRAISQANQLFTSPAAGGAFDPYRQAMGEAYQSGLGVARQVSGGQAGLFGSQAQSLYGQRLKSAGQLPAMYADLQSQYGNLYSNLVGQRVAERQSIGQHDLARFGALRNAYTQDATAYGDLMSQGQENLYGGLGEALQGLTPLIAPFFRRNQTGISELDDFNDKVTGSLVGKASRSYVRKR